MSVEHADIWVKSYTLNSRERYVCNSGFKRKAGTSSLTECVLNKTTNTAHWTTPSLKCIRDPSLTHQRPVPHSTVVTARVTPQPESPSPSGKEPAVLSPKSDTTVATETAMVPGSQSMPPQPTSSGTTSVGSHEFSQAPSQTTAKTLELTPSNSHETPDASSYSSRETTVMVSHCQATDVEGTDAPRALWISYLVLSRARLMPGPVRKPQVPDAATNMKSFFVKTYLDVSQGGHGALSGETTKISQ
ncbi:Hypothetical predicted protein [Marmota monax]|uniref:Interleukin-15 receptor subunit alpha n=1 Tax=Marmota monax TaxID=9995 RepID=A0A5E4DEN7_MARMO|nr:Hypothetical predicted protein [Marmota monax]